jgi:predicted flap endonuclease-1-like 5' DNA nuclease
MDNNEGLISPILGGWIIAALAGVLAAVLLWLLGDWTFMQGAFVGALVLVVVGAIISWIMRPLPAPGEVKIGAESANPKPKTPAATPKAATPAAKASPEAPKASTASAVTPSAALAGQAELSQRKGAWKYEGDVKPASKAAPAKKTVATDGKPELFTAPNGAADNLKLISGVGPKLEGTLNELGVWHFSQVASWRKKEIAWVDERLRFKGRIERDDWISQAKILAKGGETEFSKRKKK